MWLRYINNVAAEGMKVETLVDGKQFRGKRLTKVRIAFSRSSSRLGSGAVVGVKLGRTINQPRKFRSLSKGRLAIESFGEKNEKEVLAISKKY